MAKILIIGGGVAGLSAGIYAQKCGHHAIICEKNAVVGGNLTGWQRGDYYIDNCIHWLTGTNPATAGYKMWTELGALGNVRIYQANSLFTCEYKGKTLTLYRNLSHTISDMLKLSPIDRKEILAFAHAVHIIQGFSGIAGKNHNQKHSPVSALLSIPEISRYYHMTTGDLADRFSHPLIQKFMQAILQDQFSSLAFLLVVATFCGENGGIPAGSSYAMAERMKDTFLSKGGTLYLSKEAVKINRNHQRAVSVTFRDGQTIAADDIILTLDPKTIFGPLLDCPMPRALQREYDNPHMPRFSCYHCALSCDKDKLPFRGDYIFEIPHKYRQILHSPQIVLREFSHEPNFAPKGKSLLQTMIFCYEPDARFFIHLRETNRQAYRAKKKELEQLIEQIIVEHFPELKDNLTYIDMWTPATYKRYVGSEMGSFMSFMLPANFIPKKLNNRIPGISNIFLATQWLQAPGGLPIAAKTGKEAALKIASIHAHTSHS